MKLEMGSLCSWQCPYFWDAQLRPEVWLVDGFWQCWECLRQASEDEAGRLWPLWTTKAWVHHRCLMHAWGREGGRNALKGNYKVLSLLGIGQFPSSHCHSTEWVGGEQCSLEPCPECFTEQYKSSEHQRALRKKAIYICTVQYDSH